MMHPPGSARATEPVGDHTHTHTRARTATHAHTMHTHTYACTHTHAHTDAHTCKHMHIHACTHACTHVHMDAHRHTCMDTHTNAQAHTCTHTHAHVHTDSFQGTALCNCGGWLGKSEIQGRHQAGNSQAGAEAESTSGISPSWGKPQFCSQVLQLTGPGPPKLWRINLL